MSKQTEKDAKHIEELNALLVEKRFPGKWEVVPGSGRRPKFWRWRLEDNYWLSRPWEPELIISQLREGELTYDEREFYPRGERWNGNLSLAQHKEKAAKREASKQERAAKDARLAELEAWYAEYQNNTVSTRLEVEMPGLTKEEMKRRTDVAVEEALAKLATYEGLNS